MEESIARLIQELTGRRGRFRNQCVICDFRYERSCDCSESDSFEQIQDFITYELGKILEKSPKRDQYKDLIELADSKYTCCFYEDLRGPLDAKRGQ